MASQPIFVDTWGWLAFGHRRDTHHADVEQLLQDCRENRQPIHTSDYVLDELITLLFRREIHEEAVRFIEGLVADAAGAKLQIQRITGERFAAALELRKRYKDKPDISFTDLTTIGIMRELRLTAIVTKDRHFQHVGLGFDTLPQ
jgi:uncharacterized protein